VQVRVLLPAPNNKSTPFGVLLLLKNTGLEPICMQVSGGHLLQPVQKLVATYIFLFHLEKEKCTSSPVARFYMRYTPSCGVNAGNNHVYLSIAAAAFHVIYPPLQPASRRPLIWAETSSGP